MKKISLPLLAAAAAAVAFAGCSVEEMIGPAVAEAPSRTLKVNFSASNAATRTSFAGFNEEAGVYPVIWSGQEAVVMSLNYDDPADATLTKVTDSHATFSGAFNDTGAPYVFYALSPSSAATAISPSRNAWAVNIPVEQVPLEQSCDEAAQIIASVSDRYQSVPDPVQLHFSHVTTYVRVTLKNLDAAVSAAGVESPAVTSFDLTFEVPVAGEWYYDFENKAISEKDASYTVRALTSDLTDVWLAASPSRFRSTRTRDLSCAPWLSLRAGNMLRARSTPFRSTWQRLNSWSTPLPPRRRSMSWSPASTAFPPGTR